jgi:hypothetical protein
MCQPVASGLLSDTTIGAIVGGAIGLSGTVAVLVFEYKKWRKSLRLEYLRHRRERTEELFARIYKSVQTSFEVGVDGETQEFSIDTQGDIDFLCPPDVGEKIREAMELDPSVGRIDAVRGALATISIHMKRHLATLDQQIQEEIGTKPSRHKNGS